MSDGSGERFPARSGGLTRGEGLEEENEEKKAKPSGASGLWWKSRRVQGHEQGASGGLAGGLAGGQMSDGAYRARYGACAVTFGEFRLFLATSAGRWIEAPNRLRWGHGRAQELLVMLLAQRRAVTRGEAAAALWPESDRARRAKLLRNALWNLRRALEGLNALAGERVGTEDWGGARLLLRETAQTLRLMAARPAVRESGWDGRGERDGRDGWEERGRRAEDPEAEPPLHLMALVGMGYSASFGVWCDALAFETACQRAGAAATAGERLRWSEVALAMYTDVFMAGVEPASWIASERARLEERWARLCVDAAGALRRMGELGRALELLLEVVERRPEQAEAADHALRLLASTGRVSEALRIYERARRAFRRAYGSEPDGLRRLAAEIRAGRFAVERQGRNSGPYRRVEPADVEE